MPLGRGRPPARRRAGGLSSCLWHATNLAARSADVHGSRPARASPGPPSVRWCLAGPRLGHELIDRTARVAGTARAGGRALMVRSARAPRVARGCPARGVHDVRRDPRGERRDLREDLGELELELVERHVADVRGAQRPGDRLEPVGAVEQRLVVEHVDRRAPGSAPAQRGGERAALDEACAARVHEERVGLHPIEVLGGHDAPRRVARRRCTESTSARSKSAAFERANSTPSSAARRREPSAPKARTGMPKALA